MRHVHILPSSKIPDDDVEFKFRDRAKVLFDKWTEILSDHSDKRMKLSPAEVVPVVSMAQGEAAVHVAPLDHLVQAGQEPDRKPEGESEGPSRPSHTSKSSAEEALVVEESSAEDKTQTGVPTPESHPVLPTTDEKASQTLVALKVEVAVSTADAVVVDQPGGGPSGRDLEGEDSEWIEVPSLDG
ncbi:hypothetical protein JAAARDRAFT_245769 [Jaapia argillacea MUCL 33604]|uniref:Uncharacterized protein n=1 Tax=Jaapia argillacea MUCL 33604 TaxID=933084 RepID=A0A067QDJ5_9AGAM|nr:hypothetical protein JAAARDRAFT_245769 [Jaapia argillacea MUCL 33604]